MKMIQQLVFAMDSLCWYIMILLCLLNYLSYIFIHISRSAFVQSYSHEFKLSVVQ